MTTINFHPLQSVPSNRGWVVGNSRITGCGKDVPEENAKFVQRNKRGEPDLLYMYYPRGFVLSKLADNETDEDGWTTVHQRCLVASHSKNRCPHEIREKGYCHLSKDPEHRKFHYHFSKNNQQGMNGKLPTCRYSKEQCWDYSRDPRHKHNFFHSIDAMTKEREDMIDAEIDEAIARAEGWADM
jgi:hypothetical protein